MCNWSREAFGVAATLWPNRVEVERESRVNPEMNYPVGTPHRDWMTRDTTRRRLLCGLGVGVAGVAGCAGRDTATTGEGASAATGDESATEPESTTEGGSTTVTESTPGAESDGRDETATDEVGRVRIAHVAPNAPAVDVAVGGRGLLSQVSFGEVSTYLRLPAGERRLTVTPANGDTPLIAETVTVAPDTPYTVAVTGEVGAEADRPLAPLVLNDADDSGDDTVAIRLVHAAPDAPPVNAVLVDDGQPVFFPVAYGEVDAVFAMIVENPIQIRTAEGDPIGEFSIDATYGDLVTLFATGYRTPDDEPGQEAFDLLSV